MGRIRLYVQQSLRTLPGPAFDARGQRTLLPFLRVFAMIRVGRAAREVVDCVIDTGAPLTVFPRVQWKKFANDIGWLSVGPGRGPTSWVTNLWGRTGGSLRCKVGRVDVEAFELERGLRSLPPVSVLAQSRRKTPRTTASSQACSAVFWKAVGWFSNPTCGKRGWRSGKRKSVHTLRGEMPTRSAEPRPYRWTRDDYDLLYEAGWFADRRVQLIDGCFIEFPIQSNLQAVAVTLTDDELRKAFGSEFWVRILGELNVSRHSLPKPDLAVVPGRPRDWKDRDTPTAALLAVEVSETTLDFDRNQKGCLYAASGIADFWIVNPVDRQLEVYHDPIPDASQPFGFRYGSRVILDPSDRVCPLVLPQA